MAGVFMSHAGAISSRLDREAQHFNEVYAHDASASKLLLSDTDKQRYTNPPVDTIYPREYFYHLLSPLAGKSTLEIACGNGIDASITAHNGAQVHAYDVSPMAVELTRRRAEVNGVIERVELEVAGCFGQAFAGQKFDVITGYATLHHLPLANFGEEIYERLNVGGVAVFAEPVINSPMLQRLRNLIPYRPGGELTEDEQSLNDGDISRLAKPFDRFTQRHFQCVSRIWPMFPHRGKLVARLHRLDAKLMKVRPLRRFASVIVFGVYRDR